MGQGHNFFNSDAGCVLCGGCMLWSGCLFAVGRYCNLGCLFTLVFSRTHGILVLPIIFLNLTLVVCSVVVVCSGPVVCSGLLV